MQVYKQARWHLRYILTPTNIDRLTCTLDMISHESCHCLPSHAVVRVTKLYPLHPKPIARIRSSWFSSKRIQASYNQHRLRAVYDSVVVVFEARTLVLSFQHNQDPTGRRTCAIVIRVLKSARNFAFTERVTKLRRNGLKSCCFQWVFRFSTCSDSTAGWHPVCTLPTASTQELLHM
jgi:hypothetical protein